MLSLFIKWCCNTSIAKMCCHWWASDGNLYPFQMELCKFWKKSIQREFRVTFNFRKFVVVSHLNKFSYSTQPGGGGVKTGKMNSFMWRSQVYTFLTLLASSTVSFHFFSSALAWLAGVVSLNDLRLSANLPRDNFGATVASDGKITRLW